jgi:hypothetical protein
MSYALKWLRHAQDGLAAAYLAARADGRANEVTVAAARIESALRRDPIAQGESRDADRRVLFDPPLLVEFRVHETRRVVTVVAVSYLRRPRR